MNMMHNHTKIPATPPRSPGLLLFLGSPTHEAAVDGEEGLLLAVGEGRVEADRCLGGRRLQGLAVLPGVLGSVRFRALEQAGLGEQRLRRDVERGRDRAQHANGGFVEAALDLAEVRVGHLGEFCHLPQGEIGEPPLGADEATECVHVRPRSSLICRQRGYGWWYGRCDWCYLAVAVARSAVFFTASGYFLPASVATSSSLTKNSFSVAHSFSAKP